MVPSGLYRDVFPNLMSHLDDAVVMARKQDEEDNFVRRHILATKEMLIGRGIEASLADRLASVRMFSVPPGAYGTGIADVVEASDTWEQDDEVVSVYFNRMSHLYGQGFWGDRAEEKSEALQGRDGLSLDLFKTALSGTQAAVHSRSSNVYGTLDNDDFYQYLGSTAMAIRSIDGTTPTVYITNLTDPSSAKQETLERFMGREMRTRYLNPKWITEMLDEGYSGARFVKRVVAHLWGWQVTVPEAVDGAKWQEMYETYVEDKFDLDIEQRFRDAENLWAYQSIVARMLEVVRKGY
jgi:cobaltochelatase CobN